MSNKHDMREILDALRNDHAIDHGAPVSGMHAHQEDEHDEHLNAADDDDAAAAPAGTTAGPATVTTIPTTTPASGATGTTGLAGTTSGLTGTTIGVSATDAVATSGVAEDDLDDEDLDSEADHDASTAAGGSGATTTSTGGTDATATGVTGTATTNAPSRHGEHDQEHSIQSVLEQFLGRSLDDDSMGLMGTLMPLLNAAQNAGGGEGHGRNALLEFGTLDQFVNWLHEIEAGATDSGGQSTDLSGAASAVEHQLVIVGLIPEPVSF